MKKIKEVLDEKYMLDWHDKIINDIKTEVPLKESLGQYIPFKVKRHTKGGGYEASFVVEKDGVKLRSYKVTIGKVNKSAVSSDYGKVSSKFASIIFSEKDAGVGIANLEGGTGLYVLNTVARIVLEFARQNNPQGFTFTAAQTSNDDGTPQSRRKAYRALALMLGKEAGYVNITKVQAMTTGAFYIMRHDLFEAWQDAVNSSGIS